MDSFLTLNLRHATFNCITLGRYMCAPRSRPSTIPPDKSAADEAFDSRESELVSMLIELSRTGRPCDVTFFDRKPILNVKVLEKLFLALAAGHGEFAQLLSRIEFSGGMIVGLAEIWTINPMPENGFSDVELAAVDLNEAEKPIGPHGETMRKMISDTYHCTTREEEDRFLRRFIAS
jgi:hypothetical protein